MKGMKEPDNRELYTPQERLVLPLACTACKVNCEKLQALCQDYQNAQKELVKKDTLIASLREQLEDQILLEIQLSEALSR